ncbi:MAG: hypothetical protein FJY97_06240 [candidate division Zixibacteria bacterium]|nr:hypothetical protein [candidate division Zixibacteria bacterium]
MRPIRKIRIQHSGVNRVTVAVGGVAVMVGLTLGYLGQVVQMYDLKRDIFLLEQRKKELFRENAHLIVEINRQSGQDEIAPVAMNTLRLEYPMVGQVVAISETPAPVASATASERTALSLPSARTHINPVASVPLAPSGNP